MVCILPNENTNNPSGKSQGKSRRGRDCLVLSLRLRRYCRVYIKRRQPFCPSIRVQHPTRAQRSCSCFFDYIFLKSTLSSDSSNLVSLIFDLRCLKVFINYCIMQQLKSLEDFGGNERITQQQVSLCSVVSAIFLQRFSPQ